MTEEEVKLIGMWASPYSRKIEVALKLKGVKYEYIEENLSNKSPLLQKSNPIYKKIPVLIHKGKPVCESLLILEYIDETWKGVSILPQDPYERSIARLWAKFIDEKCLPALWKAFWSKGKDQEKDKEEAREHLRVLEEQLMRDNKKFFGGNNIGFVDIAGMYIAFWAGGFQELLGIDDLLTKERFPRLCQWIHDFINCDVIRTNLPSREDLIAFFKIRFSDASSSSK